MRSVFRSLVISAALSALAAAPSLARGEVRADFLMHSDPELIVPRRIKAISPNCLPLWLGALRQPDADGQRQAANSIAEAHHLAGEEVSKASPLLATIVAAGGTHPATRHSAARALIALDARDSAQILFASSQAHGADLRQLVEPALARWRFEPIRALWRSRLADSTSGHRDLELAIRGAGETEDVEAAASLLEIIEDSRRPAAVRVSAARSLGRIQSAGLEPIADRLRNAAGASLAQRLCAATLLTRHDSEAARAALIELSRDSEPSVAAMALRRLNEIDPGLVLPLAGDASRNRDTEVRRQAVEALQSAPTKESIGLLAPLLDDPHPGVRRRVCQILRDFSARAELDELVRQGAMTGLTGEGWRAQEQSALLLAALDHKSAAERLVALLESPRGEVKAASAWGLRKLAVPATLPAMLDKAKRQTATRAAEGTAWIDQQVAHLCEAFGTMQYREAGPLLRMYIPKNFSMGDLSRPAAIWALGKIHAGVVEVDLARLLVERLVESESIEMPERPEVRAMSAVSLARMRADAAVPYIRDYFEAIGPHSTRLSAAAIRWAIRELTGEVLPEAHPQVVVRTGWFLEPLDPGMPTRP